MKALSIWPTTQGSRTPVQTKGYSVVLTKRNEPATWLRLPAGTWQLPPSGQYSLLLEGNSRVSPFPVNLKWNVQRFDGRGWAILQNVVSAGRVHAIANCPKTACTSWMLHESSNIQTPIPYFAPEMLRHSHLGDAQRTGILMPSGRIAVAVYDSSSKQFLALQAPVEVVPFKTVITRPSAPRPGRAALILEVERPSSLDQRPEDDASVALYPADGKRREAAMLTRTHQKLIAVWPDVPAGFAHIELQSSICRLSETDIRLRSEKIEHVSRRATAAPKARK